VRPRQPCSGLTPEAQRSRINRHLEKQRRISDEIARHASHVAREAISSQISVHCDDSKWAKKAEEILEATGGKDVVKTSEASADYRP
jgi:hypothetical protein